VLVNRVVTTAPTPVSTPVQEEEAPAKRAAPKRQPVWPIFAWLILLSLIGGGFLYMRQVEQLLGLLPRGVSDTTAVVAPVAAVDSLPQVAIIPQGEATDSVPAASPISVRGAGVKAGAPNVATVSTATTTAATTTAANATATQPATQAVPSTRSDSLSSVRSSLLPHPWLRVNGDSGAPHAVDENVAPEILQRLRLDEVQGHLAQLRRYAGRGDVAHARAAYRDASTEARGLELADPSVRSRLSILLSIAQREAMQACQAAHADTLNPFAAQVDCGPLFAW
jgi:hypothetical protein